MVVARTFGVVVFVLQRMSCYQIQTAVKNLAPAVIVFFVGAISYLAMVLQL
jgi:hypothetical protein